MVREHRFPRHAGVCPKPVVQAFGKTFVMDSICSLTEEHRETIRGAMLLTFALLALLIVLSA